MSDADVGSATATVLDAGSPGAANGDGGQGSNAGAADPLAGLETGSREWAEKNGVKSIAEAVTAAREAQSLIGKSVRVPGDDAKAEDWEQFSVKIGRPDKAEGYELKRPEGLPEEEFRPQASGLAEVLHKAGAPKRVGDAVIDAVFTASAEQRAADEAERAEAYSNASKAINEAYGGQPDSATWKTNYKLATDAIKLGGPKAFDALKAAGLMSEDGKVIDPAFMIGFAELGKRIFTEDTVRRGDPASGTDNLFKDGPDAGNITEQNRLIKQDPAKAQRLMREAGHKPEEWNLTPLSA